MLVILFALVGGLGVHAASSSGADSAYSHIQVYSEVLHRIRTEYVEEPNMPAVTNGALHGMLESLDANSSFLTAAEYKRFKQSGDGKAGIGATVSKRFGYAAVVSVIPGGPAEKAGVTPGDILEFVDNQSTQGMSLAALKLRLSGEPGSRVECAIIRARKVEPQKVTLVREVIAPPAVTEQVMGDVGYVKALALTKGKAQDIANKIKSLQKQGVKKLVLDLRNDSLGDEEEGVAVANLFLGKGTIATLQGQKYEKVTYTADPQKKITDLPVAVLVNRGSAGASELVAAAIFENQRGDVVGDKTWGEGSIQKLIEVPDGSALILSIAKYYTPNGKIIQDTGITPNVQVAMGDDLAAALPDDDDGAASPDEPQKTTPATKEDDQLRKAIDVLKARAQKTS